MLELMAKKRKFNSTLSEELAKRKKYYVAHKSDA
jgi:hypothetical protein